MFQLKFSLAVQVAGVNKASARIWLPGCLGYAGPGRGRDMELDYDTILLLALCGAMKQDFTSTPRVCVAMNLVRPRPKPWLGYVVCDADVHLVDQLTDAPPQTVPGRRVYDLALVESMVRERIMILLGVSDPRMAGIPA